MNYYYYIKEGSGLIRIKGSRKPVKRSLPYIVQEFYKNTWQMPCFPEISFSNLKTFTYIGKTQKKDKQLLTHKRKAIL